MGREIRKVPTGWHHPRNEQGHFQPLYNESFKEAAQEWTDNFINWQNGTHKHIVEDPALKVKYPFYWQWSDGPPDEEYYRPEFDSEPTCFQIYETVSEGTPTSPVFNTKQDMITWLISEGYGREQAENFVSSEWAPSMILSPKHGLEMGIHAMHNENCKAKES